MESLPTRESNELSKRIQVQLVWIIAISTAIRLLLATWLELGNDEVYYWTYALYPDLSHFDHPPMVGLVIKFFTLNGLLKDDFFMRLGPIFFSGANTWLIFLIARKIGDELSGLYAAYLFNGSIYCSILCGFAIIPDAPLMVFWLLSLYLLIDLLPAYTIDRATRIKMILFGAYAGLAILCKYHGVFIWIGAFVYILIHNRKWLTDYSLYVAVLLSIVCVLPIVVWNLQNDFISFSFHGERVAPTFDIRLDYLIRELLGQVAYQNPLNFIVLIPALIALIKRKSFMDPQLRIILVLNGFPLWVLFTGFSFFRATLPHWTGPSYISLILMASVYWSVRLNKNKEFESILQPIRIMLPMYFLICLLSMTVYLINYSPFNFGIKERIMLGENDFTQDMYGWNCIGKDFKQLAEWEEKNGRMASNSDLISFRWFPGAHLDFYAAAPAGRKLFLMGDLKEIHKYAWINVNRGGMIKGKDYYYIAPSNYYRDPYEIFNTYFDRIDPIDTILVKRSQKIMRYAFIYRMKGYRGNFNTSINLHTTNERSLY